MEQKDAPEVYFDILTKLNDVTEKRSNIYYIKSILNIIEVDY